MENNNDRGIRVVSGGVGYGAVLATVISFTTYKSIGWAIVHGICGWFYVIYYACTRTK